LQSDAVAKVDSGGDRLMAKAPSFGNAFAGRWHIFERTTGQRLSRSCRRGAISRSRASLDGEIVFNALKCFLDVRYEREAVRPTRVLMGRARRE